VAKGSTATRGVAPGAAATAVAGSWLAALLDWDFGCELWAVSSGFEMQPPVSFLLVSVIWTRTNAPVVWLERF